MDEHDSFIRPDAFWHSLSLRSGQSVAHLGCGAGFYIISAARIVGKKGKVIGVDILAHMLGEVENRAHQFGLEKIVQTFRSNVENVPGSPIPEKSIDWVLIANILHESDPVQVFAEAKRIVGANGNVVVVEWNLGATPFGPPGEKRRSVEEIMAVAEGAGLSLKKQFEPSPYHVGLVFSS